MTIDIRVISRQLGFLLLVLGGLQLVIALFGVVDDWGGKAHGFKDVFAVLLSAGIGCLTGLLLVLSGKTTSDLVGRREALLLVALSWILGSVLASLPYLLWALLRADRAAEPHPFDQYINCYFEAMSGLTTTGSTILTTIGTLPRSLLLWRAGTQWLGGLGIVVLFVAILPILGVGGRRILRVELGAARQGVRPQIKDAARALWLIYVGLTVAGTIALRICGMTWFDALAHTFTGISTGGFSTYDASIGAYQSSLIHWVTIAIMLLGSINFVLFHLMLQRRWKSALKDPELRVFILIVGVATAIITASLLLQTPAMYLNEAGQRVSFWIVLRDAAFQLVAIMTTTGFATADFDAWAFPAKTVLLVVAFIGGCAGATTGGLKVSRIVIAIKASHEELERTFRPTIVRATTVGKTVIPADMKFHTLILVLLYAMTFGVGTAGLMVSEGSDRIDITTAATATIAAMNTTGPGLAEVGPTKTFTWMTLPSKLILCFLMLLGRLEVITIAVLFLPQFWREE